MKTIMLRILEDDNASFQLYYFIADMENTNVMVIIGKMKSLK